MNNWKAGEKLFSSIMTERGYQVQDVSDSPQFWKKDIDFVITSPTSGETKTFEVKWDSRINKTGNLFLETYSNGGKGWFKYCEADYLAYGDARSRCFYIIPLLELRELVASKRFEVAFCGNESCGYLVGLESVKDIAQPL